MSECVKCHAPTVEAELMNGQRIILDAQPSREGQVFVVNGQAAILSGAELVMVRNARLPCHTRHGVRCSEFWRDR